MNIEGSYSGLSMAELSDLRAQRFQSADADSSGGLTLEEMLQGRQNLPSGNNGPSIEDMFAQMDADGDGEVTQSEMDAAKPPSPPMDSAMSATLLSSQETGGFAEQLSEAFATADADSDGYLDDDEDETGTEQTVSLLAKMTRQAYANTASGASSYRTLTGAFF